MADFKLPVLGCSSDQNTVMEAYRQALPDLLRLILVNFTVDANAGSGSGFSQNNKITAENV
ncbi:hypothetical protein KKI24_11785 [bacterium]|nr:hypothetical protein [bacterium]